MSKKLQSMTGFSTIEGEVAGQWVRLEIKSLNHRYLDLKVRTPREFSTAEMQIRSAVQAGITRGSVDFKIDRIRESDSTPPPIQANISLAAHYYESLKSIQQALGLSDPIRTSDIAAFPDVISCTPDETAPEDVWPMLEPLVTKALDKLVEAREREAATLRSFLHKTAAEMSEVCLRLRERRRLCEDSYRARIREKIKLVFEAYPVQDPLAKTVLESRISQELAMLLDRTDIEEELTRFASHLDHLCKTLDAGGNIGRKLDFILQELNREINTLGNKAQDFQISEDVVGLKVRLEQLREQVMNFE